MRDASLQVFGSFGAYRVLVKGNCCPSCALLLPTSSRGTSFLEGSWRKLLNLFGSSSFQSSRICCVLSCFCAITGCSGLYLILVVVSTLLSALLFSRYLFYFGREILVSKNTAAFNSPFQLPLGINILSPSVVKILRS